MGLAQQENAEELSAAAGLPPREPLGDSQTTPAWDDPREQWRRRVYPAGRILHLVPLHLVPGETQDGQWVARMCGCLKVLVKDLEARGQLLPSFATSRSLCASMHACM